MNISLPGNVAGQRHMGNPVLNSLEAVMKRLIILFCVLAMSVSAFAVEMKNKPAKKKVNILFLHHSTGQCIWLGGVKAWFDAYNKNNGTDNKITDQIFGV